MNKKIRAFNGRFTAILTLALFLSQLFLGELEGASLAWADDIGDLNIRAPHKDDLAKEETDDMTRGSNGSKSNVLFLLESTAIMSFTPKGVMPTIVRKSNWFDQSLNQDNIDWDATEKKFGIKMEDINTMMEQATFGMGALPVAMTGGDLRRERNLYGRDVDPSNNYVKMSNDPAEDLRLNAEQGRHYYAPFMRDGATLVNAYKKQKTPLNVKYEGKDGKTPIPKVWFSATRNGKINPDINKIEYNFQGVDYDSEYNTALPRGLQGGSVVSSASYNTLRGNSFPYALVMHYPIYGGDGWARTSSYNYQYKSTELVPNDSRMYQAKLVLWRILEEEENRLLKNIRFGLASTFLSLANVTDINDNSVGKAVPGQVNAYSRYDTGGIFKVEPYGSNVHAVDEKYSGIQFKNGILNHGITGNVANWSGIHGQLFPLWMNPPISPIYDPNPALNIENNPKNPDGLEWNLPAREMYKLLNRASLHVPIADYNHVWTTPDGKTKMSQADKVRMWINGFADIKGAREGWSALSTTYISSFMEPEKRSSQFHFYKDPEIGIAGTFQLPMAIFPNPKIPELNRESYIDKGYIWYSAKNSHANYFGDFRYGSTTGKSYGDFYVIASPRANYNAGSGEAAGSVLDFFSPPANLKVENKSIQKQAHSAPVNAIQLALGSKTGNAVDFKVGTRVTARDLDPVSFPIRADCEENWLVVIASGQEMEPISDREKSIAYPSYEAIKNLYEYTSTHPMNTVKRDAKGDPILSPDGKVQIVQAASPTPIKTLVIGVVGDPKKETHAPTKKILEKMRENLAKMARAGVGDDPDDETSPGAPLFAENVDELSEQFRQALFIINESRINQPGRGALLESPVLENEDAESDIFTSTYRIIEGDQWDAALTRYEVSRDVNGAMVMTEKWELGKKILADRNSRKLRYWANGAWVSLVPDDSRFGRLTGMATADGRMDPGNLKDGTFGGTEPYNALYHWLKGFNYSYATGKLSGRPRMLADFGQSGVTLVDNPSRTDSLPGYLEWSGNMSAPQAAKLYAQTNDGILHIVDPLSGNEDSAILPPPVLLPSRIATLKTDMTAAGRLQWIDDARSNPSFILDGPLQKRHFDLEQRGDATGWGTYVLGTLGRGGNGLYMMDATNHANPSFMWYREKSGDKLITMDKNDLEPKVKSANLSAGEAGYLSLGFNSPKPAMGVTGALTPTGNLQNFIAIPGGTPAEVDPGKNGSEGSILLLVDPKDGNVLRAFSGDSMEGHWRIGKKTTGSPEISYMGMMTSEPTLFRSKTNPYLTGKIFTADNRGNIYSVLLEETGSDGKINALSRTEWKIRTIATLQKDIETARAAENRANYVVPHGLAASVSGSAIWLAGGTADIGVKLTPGAPKSGVIENERQMIFAIKTSENQERPFARSSLKPLRTADDILSPSEGYEGWYVELEPEKQNNFRGEYVSAKPIIVGGTLYIATFTPSGKIDTESAAVCGLVRNVTGTSRLYAVDVTSGRGNTWGGNEKCIVLKGIKITGLTLLKQGKGHNLLVTYDVLESGNNIDSAVAREQNLSHVTDGNGNPLQQLNVALLNNDGPPPLDGGETVLLFWHMK